ncbi:hypothetical protein MN116_001553 [Schistosoma mekongi]|uniref:Sperm-tail PG-rich repeat-containing protein 2 n=1 Tax=Schistosoma mekongi TaxID=38744 RepID=A0AAE1ZI59_SCHME|nr:hypothetical protein MN116_001553 [Schistosoma mekongi]
MYDRQKRIFTFQEKSGTDENLGPGSYFSWDSLGFACGIGYAPFDSLTERKLNFSFADAEKFPSPAKYFPKLPSEKVKGCSSISNRANRFPSFHPNGPAPDAYNIASVWARTKKNPFSKLLPKMTKLANGQQDHGKRLISYDRIFDVRHRDVPSIPSGQFVHGYEEGLDGQLYPHSGPKRDETLGPAFYGPTRDPIFTVYRGCGWSKSTSGRSLPYKASYSVGPGQYNPYSDYWLKLIETAKARNSIEAEHPLAVPRFIDKVVYELHKQNFPGPCSYNVHDKQTSIANMVQAPFNTEELRFKEKVIDTPAPNTYVPRSSAISQRWLRRFRPKPFDATTERFNNKSDTRPAPNSYNIDDGITHHLIVPRLDKCVGFGSTAKRLNDKLLFSKTSSGGQDGIPGPGQYDPQKYDEKNASKAIGIPKAKREISMPISSVPPPGTYDFGKSFDVTQCKRTPAIPYTVEGRERRNCFSNTAERFGKNSALGPKDPDMPGPAEYFLPESKPQRGKFVCQSERFKEIEKEQTPGPADYEVMFILININFSTDLIKFLYLEG